MILLGSRRIDLLRIPNERNGVNVRPVIHARHHDFIRTAVVRNIRLFLDEDRTLRHLRWPPTGVCECGIIKLSNVYKLSVSSKGTLKRGFAVFEHNVVIAEFLETRVKRRFVRYLF